MMRKKYNRLEYIYIMDKRDVLESDIRVTVLGENGQYVFDWIDYEKRSVKFIPNQSDYDEYNDEVKKVLNDNGIFIGDSSETVEENSTNVDNVNTTIDKVEPIDGGDNLTSDAGNSVGDIQPKKPETEDESSSIETHDDNDETSLNSEPVSSPDSGTDNKKDDTNFEPVSSPDSGTNDKNEKSTDSTKKSFIVRLEDAENRRNIIEDIKSEYSDAASKMELTGPYRVTYEVSSDGIKLDKVEDLGIGSTVE